MSSVTATVQQLPIAVIGWLDALPDAFRAVLTALVLAAVLAAFEKRIPAREVHYGRSFRKAALIALLVIPALAWLVPESRMVVFVETLPGRSDAIHHIALVTCVVWAAGALVSMIVALSSWYRRGRRLRTLPTVEDGRLTNRLAHWRTRLGMAGPQELHLSPGDEPRFLDSGSRLLFPAAALRWPTNQQDVLIINALCGLKHHHHRWHRLAQLVTCVYWPVTWVQSLHTNLRRDFEFSASDLAGSCYQDRLGYARTLRQLGQRLAPGDRARPGNGAGRPPGTGARYGTALARVLHPADPIWLADEPPAMLTRAEEARWKDPYDRVVLFVGQAIFVAVLLTGVTLRERPPDSEERYLMPFGLLWKEHFHRNLELRDRVQPGK